MGPSNVALVNLYRADQQFRDAQARLEAATKSVRIQQRKVNDLAERIRAGQQALKQQQATGMRLDVELRSKDQHIEKLRTQQQNARNDREYKAFIVEINTGKVDRSKIEEEAVKVLEATERQQAELKDAQAALEAEQQKLATMQSQINDTTAKLQAEVEGLKAPRQAAYDACSPRGKAAFDKLADRFDGEALAPIARPNRRVEEYMCTACNMDLVRDVYNRLHAKDEPVFCPSCGRILYIPDDLTPELAVDKPKPRREPKGKKDIPAAMVRQESADAVLRSVRVEDDDAAAADDDPAPAATADAGPAGDAGEAGR